MSGGKILCLEPTFLSEFSICMMFKNPLWSSGKYLLKEANIISPGDCSVISNPFGKPFLIMHHCKWCYHYKNYETRNTTSWWDNDSSPRRHFSSIKPFTHGLVGYSHFFAAHYMHRKNGGPYKILFNGTLFI